VVKGKLWEAVMLEKKKEKKERKKRKKWTSRV